MNKKRFVIFESVQKVSPGGLIGSEIEFLIRFTGITVKLSLRSETPQQVTKHNVYIRCLFFISLRYGDKQMFLEKQMFL